MNKEEKKISLALEEEEEEDMFQQQQQKERNASPFKEVENGKRRGKKEKKNSPRNLHNIIPNTLRTNLNHRKSRIFRFRNMSHTQNISINRLQALHKFHAVILLRQIQIRRQSPPACQTRTEEGEETGHVVGCGVDFGEQFAEVGGPGRVVFGGGGGRKGARGVGD